MEETKYGVLLLRAQPFHNGHNSIVQQIIRDGKIPILILGGMGKVDDRHPLNVYERTNLIELIYKKYQIKVIGMMDFVSWDKWFRALTNAVLDITKGRHFTLYAHEKPEDGRDFTFQSVEYKNESHNICFKVNNIPIRYCETYHDRTGNVVSATKIREDKSYASTHLDARIYKQLKEWEFWKC